MDLATLARLHREHVDALAAQYAKVLREAELDAVAIHSGTAQKKSAFDDQYWPLRVVPHFQHWAPLAQPDCAIVVQPGKRPKLAWQRAFDFWEAPRAPETDHFVESFDVVEITKVEAVEDLLPDGRVAFVGEDTTRAERWGIRQVNPEGLVKALDALRVKKTPYEVMCLAEANRRASAGHRAVLDVFRAGEASELDLHLLYLRATAQDDPETPYKNIVALNEHASTLHHVTYTKHAVTAAGAPAQSLLVDAGAMFQGYGSDVTRTHVKGTGATAAAFAALVAGVEAMQQRLCARVAIGAPYEELHDESHRQVAAILRDVGVASLSEAELVDRGVTRAFYPHGLGHSLGLQTHDVGCALMKPREDNPFLRNTSRIEVGQVFTIEPGVYFIEPLLAPLRAKDVAKGIDWKLVGELAKLGGVRIEDDVVVVEGATTTRNLTREVLP
jgi:Xaa-Pro dipeptidase